MHIVRQRSYSLLSAAMMTLTLCMSCSAGKSESAEVAADTSASETPVVERPAFDADSAYSYVKTIVEFGPRVPNTEAHRLSGDWLAGKLRGFGWQVVEQETVLSAFDGTPLNTRNIFAQINPELPDRLLLLAHWDSRPWADEDPDPAKRNQPVLGANDGASGIGVLLEIARQLQLRNSKAAIDILFVDAEDWGEDNNEESWAMGTRYFAENPPVEGYRPAQAILLDMVGSPNAQFGYEYFSSKANPYLMKKIWNTASELGHDKYFRQQFGGAVTDDHVELINHGIPAVDIIDYRNSPEYQGFDPVWHTTSDNMGNISRETLRAVGETVMAVAEDNN